MSYYLYAFRESVVAGRDSPMGVVEENLPMDATYQEAAASLIAALGWDRFVMDFAEVAAASGMTVHEARAAFVNIELNHDAPMLQVQVMPYGLEVQIPWFSPDEQQEALDVVRRALATANSVERLMVFDPQAGAPVNSFSALSNAYRSAAANTSTFVESAEFQEQINKILSD